MKIGSYNVRGLGSETKKVEVSNFFFHHNLDFLCLQETKMESFSDQDGMHIWKTNDILWSAEGAIGRAGGILSCWNGKKFTCISSWSLGGAVIVNGWWNATSEDCCIINVYAPCALGDKERFWDRLGLAVSQISSRNLLIIGDFNSILHPSERAGTSDSFSLADINAFKLFVDSYHLIDVGLRGRKFTWYRSNGSCKSRIDRALINENWAATWSDSSLRGLPRSFSDHCPLILQSTQTDWGPKPFRFINAWLSHPNFTEVVRNSWNRDGIHGWGCYVFKEKLKRLREDLKRWNIEEFGLLDRNISDLRDKIHLLDTKDDSQWLSLEEAADRQEATAHLLLNLSRKRDLLAQKARLRWIKDGDINSSLFHKCINKRRIQNSLVGLNIQGTWNEDPSRIKSEVKNFFKSVFSARSASPVTLPDDIFSSRLNSEDGDFLTRSFSEEEIKSALWECDSSKSPGPDGFNMGFYKHCWNIIREDLLSVFNDFHSHGKLTKGSNPSFIALIPKKDDSFSLDSFRPISLIGSLYKIIAKVLAHRLKSVLGKIIGDTQTAFLHGRFILDGVVALNEVIEDARKTKAKRIFLKIDFAKAFDSIAWDYLLTMKRKLNFPEKWISWIHACLSSSKANVLVNGSPSGEFELQRGVRQGDPLSPFLFLIAAEGLNLLTRRAVDRNLLQVPRIGRNSVLLSHLQYADDTIFIVNGESENVQAIRWLLMNFEMISGLSVNYDKCRIYGTNLCEGHLLHLAKEFGCPVGSLPIPYLGLKVGGTLRCYDGWQEITKKLERRTKKWDTKSLSLAGRTTIIKSVLSSIPIYALSFMPLPKKSFNEITRIQRNFLWGCKGNEKKIAWIKWDDLLLPKSEGGLGFINLLSFNTALLCKWVWRFLSPEDSLWKRIIVSRHGFPSWATSGSTSSTFRQPSTGWWSNILRKVQEPNGSWFWKLVRRKLGDGKDTSFWEGAWLDGTALKNRFPRLFHLCSTQDASVNDMGVWENGVWTWKIKWRRELRCSEQALERALFDCLTVHPSAANSKDMWEWSRKPSNQSIVRHLYLELENSRCPSSPPRQPNRVYNLIWSSVAIPKAQILSWRICRNRLPTFDNLRKRIDLNGTETLCCFCKEKEESCAHIFLDCKKVRIVWDEFASWIGILWVAPNTTHDHLLSFSFLQGGKKRSKLLCGLWICIVWVWWKWRNAIIYEKDDWNIHRIIVEMKCRFWNWCLVRGEVDPRITFESWRLSPRFLS